MSKSLVLAGVITALVTGSAVASDLPNKKKAPPAPVVEVSPFDFAFGASVKSNYVSRGISNSAMKPAAAGYFEGRYNEIFYANVAYNTVDLPTKPAGEVDLAIGARPVFGKLTVDLGAVYYVYPSAGGLNTYGTTTVTPGVPNYFEGYLKPTYAVTDKITLGANLYASPNWGNTGATDVYTSATFKVTLPYDLAVSGEFGRQFLGTSKAYIGGGNPVKYPDYNTWNAGITYTYKQASLDLRYSGTDLSKTECGTITSDPKGLTSTPGRSKWCGNTFLATLAVDFVYSELKK